jgi:serine/threonine protein kinase
MHKHYIAHLDISLTNLLTDYMGRCAYIDYELSRRFESTDPTHLVYNYRGTELPPESGKDTPIDPYKVDVWALAVLLLRSCKVCLQIIFILVSCSSTLQLTGFWVPQLMHIIKPMLDEDPSRRPSSFAVLQAFDKLIVSLGLQTETGADKSCYD